MWRSPKDKAFLRSAGFVMRRGKKRGRERARVPGLGPRVRALRFALPSKNSQRRYAHRHQQPRGRLRHQRRTEPLGNIVAIVAGNENRAAWSSRDTFDLGLAGTGGV